MKYFLKLSFGFWFLNVFFSSCSNEKTFSTEEKHKEDSLSKISQEMIADSLKKRNPLLILPPDTDYTGSYIDKYPNGIKKFIGFFRFGKRHGQWLSFFPNGNAWSEMHYDKGLRHGPNTVYFENGKIRYSGFYKFDKQDSLWIFYDTLGKVAEKVIYKNDRLVQRLPIP